MPDEQPVQRNRPPEGEIPDILEWKLDVIMEQLAKMGGGKPDPVPHPRTQERLPKIEDRKRRDPIPDAPGIPKILEWKLDGLLFDLDDIANDLDGPGGVIQLLTGIELLLAFIFGALIIIGGWLIVIGLLLLGLNALLAAILALLFLILGLFVPLYVINRRRRHRFPRP